MQTSCLKLVNNSVYKFVKNSCKIIVKKSLVVNKIISLGKPTQVFTSFSQRFYTWISKKSNLLKHSFARFTHSSTITTKYI